MLCRKGNQGFAAASSSEALRPVFFSQEASMASSVYVRDISDSDEECRATISTGVSVNHLITILVALFGGWIWRTLGIETLFIISAVLGLCNSAYAATIKTGRMPKRSA